LCLRRAFSGLFKFSILRNIKTVINSRINSQAILTFITLGIFCTRSQSNTKDIEESSINHKRDLVLGLPFDTPFKANDMETFAICWRCNSSANNGKMSAIFLAPQLGKSCVASPWMSLRLIKHLFKIFNMLPIEGNCADR
jgi:hypothetical protein